MHLRLWLIPSSIIAFSAIFIGEPQALAAVTNLSIASPDAVPTLPADYTFTQQITLTNKTNATAYDVKAAVVLLAPETSYSEVELVQESQSPVNTYHDQYGNLIGTFLWNAIAPHTSVNLTLTYTATSSEVSYHLPTTYPPYNVRSSVYKFYTNPQLESQQVNTDSPVLEQIDQSVIKPGENPEQKAQALFNWVVQNIHYNYSLQASGSAVATAETHLGICSDFADLYVGLLRTAKIPARFVGGYVTSNGSGQGGFHQWVEFYLPTVGWVVADPTWGAYGYFASLQDHWHIGLYDGIRKDITVTWNYSPQALTASQAAKQITISYQYQFHKTVPIAPLKPVNVIKHKTTKKVRPILDPPIISHKVQSVPLNFWQQLWLSLTQWVSNRTKSVVHWFAKYF
ncbi:Transglutaminase-like superfamily protein [Sulfobacillus thermosulfidooxidans DSM 9293]|uniref:Transglutaminase-like superfamily protein n=1 Tax=Sulfobacillus thermosulfidooxidans (strain DSM 9293 / VKM B-1269 / AT-1) TaxID=929705 RepID=A0A1W1WDP6_SULTA|nr:transglutaminase-like domain-containing protein [Sulfobacillus thermosulfidooxidans]SMC04299.1 Transglutaminase-like superfamily protein [Sulfobacillus thermosulfidooxidans DSM 9293]